MRGDLIASGTVLAFALAWCSSALALNPDLDVSQYAHTSWKIRDGFAKGTITSIAQTPDGYLWLGTELGLVCFDGVRPVAWEPPPGQQLPSRNIQSLLVTRDDALWIGTEEGLARWKDGRLSRYEKLLGTARRRIPDDSAAKPTIDKIEQKLMQMGTDIRQLSHDLHPPILQEAGLPEAVRSYCDQFSASSGITVACDADDNVRDLSRGAALALFRIVQEALGNAAKHAHAKRITVRLTRAGDDVSLTVSDDGAGFDANRLAASGGLGLVMMRERATQLNGTFHFESAPGRGTTITVVIPFR